jgi:hypothetical protein
LLGYKRNRAVTNAAIDGRMKRNLREQRAYRQEAPEFTTNHRVHLQCREEGLRPEGGQSDCSDMEELSEASISSSERWSRETAVIWEQED